ncbi:MAG TPA: dockerin type I repeat-containing protein, partial [Planctomycetota bacterium]|nr:dockerin type I repeat-containing protein [Planctomycetota bacterium]
DCDDSDCAEDPNCQLVGECPDWAFYFGSAATENSVELSEGDSISIRNATDAFAFSGGVKATENGGTVTFEFSGDLGTDNQRLVELIITDDQGNSQTPVTPNTATASGHVQSLSRGPAIAGFSDGDFFAFDVAPGVGGPGFTFGYVSDLDGEENKIPATGTEGCPVNEVLIVSFQAGAGGSFQRGDADGNGRINVSDAVWIIQIAVGNFTPIYDCQEALDANDDGSVNVSDALPVLAWIFQRGEPLPDPFLVCGQDNDGDAVSCAESSPVCGQ